MNKNFQNVYRPDYAVLPGETLRETIEAYGMSQAELAVRLGTSRMIIGNIIAGKDSITTEISLRLERVLGVPSSFWMNLERNYQDALCRIPGRTA